MKLITVIILTFNEELHIGRCLEAVAPIAGRVVIVDSFSTDRTVEIARAHGAEVLQNKFVNQAKQFQWGIDNAGVATPWVMRLDADEIVEPDLIAEIQAKLPLLGADVAGVNLRRKHIFWDRWIRHGGRFPLLLLRIWRTGQGRVEDRWMDEHIVIWGGTTVVFDGGFADHNLNDLSHFTDKHNKYATREAIDVLLKKYALQAVDENLVGKSASFQASIKRLFKEKLYNKLPFWIGPFAYFIYRYLFQLGFLDGRAGVVYHFLQGYWYRFLVGAKIAEYDRVLEALSGVEARLEALERLTGQKLRP